MTTAATMPATWRCCTRSRLDVDASRPTRSSSPRCKSLSPTSRARSAPVGHPRLRRRLPRRSFGAGGGRGWAEPSPAGAEASSCCCCWSPNPAPKIAAGGGAAGAGRRQESKAPSGRSRITSCAGTTRRASPAARRRAVRAHRLGSGPPSERPPRAAAERQVRLRAAAARRRACAPRGPRGAAYRRACSAPHGLPLRRFAVRLRVGLLRRRRIAVRTPDRYFAPREGRKHRENLAARLAERPPSPPPSAALSGLPAAVVKDHRRPSLPRRGTALAPRLCIGGAARQPGRGGAACSEAHRSCCSPSTHARGHFYAGVGPAGSPTKSAPDVHRRECARPPASTSRSGLTRVAGERRRTGTGAPTSAKPACARDRAA